MPPKLMPNAEFTKAGPLAARNGVWESCDEPGLRLRLRLPLRVCFRIGD
jgi:hypothetical protein